MENKIKEYRQHFGYSQEEMAKRLGVSRQTIISIEKGKFSPSLDLSFKISHLFKCSIENLFLSEQEKDD